MVCRSSGIAPLPLARQRWFFPFDLFKKTLSIAIVKRGVQRQQFVERYAQRVDVGAMVDQSRVSQRLFRTYVSQGTDDGTGVRQGRRGLTTSQSEIADHRFAPRSINRLEGLMSRCTTPNCFAGVLQGVGRLNAESGDGINEVAAAMRERGGKTAVLTASGLRRRWTAGAPLLESSLANSRSCRMATSSDWPSMYCML